MHHDIVKCPSSNYFFIYGTLKLRNIHLHGEDILTLDYGSVDLRAYILVFVQ